MKGERGQGNAGYNKASGRRTPEICILVPIKKSINFHILQERLKITAKHPSSRSYCMKEIKFKGRSLGLETPILFDSVLIVKQVLGDNEYGPSPISCPQE